MRFYGLAALIGSVLGLLISLPYASAWGYYTGDVPQWVISLRPIISPFQSFADLPRVYEVYAQLFVISALGHLAGMHGLYRLRRFANDKTNLERKGIIVAYCGIVLSTIGVVTDGWLLSPPGFFAVIFATPIIGIGMMMLSVALHKVGLFSRIQVIIISICGITSLPFSLLVFQHTPSGQLLLLHVVWIIVGFVLLTKSRGRAIGKTA